MGAWTKKTLSQLANVEMGQSPPSQSYNTDRIGVPFLQGCTEFGEKYPNHIKYCSKPAKIASMESVLISVRAPVGELNIAEQEYCIGRGLAAISAKECDKDFLYYLYSKTNGS